MTTAPVDEKGLSYVPQIKAAYSEVLSAEKNSSEKKLKLGTLLNDAKKEIGHGKWTAYLQKHFPEISHRSLNVYMQLADPDNKAKFEATSNSQRAAILDSGGVTSVRKALSEIKTEEEKDKAARARAKAKAKAARLKKATASATIEDLLLELEVDEVYEALKSTHNDKYLLDLAHTILAKNKEGDIPTELDRRPPPIGAERRA
jgi:hypothetical protein